MTVVAIDGPAGAGKTSVATAVAEALGFEHIDTGGMYRAVALLAIESSIDPSDGERLAEVCRENEVRAVGGKVLIGGRDVTTRVRERDVTGLVSVVAAQREVREEMTAAQRALAGEANVVMEGRDIGSVVFPDADVKIYLTASLEERARRRSAESGDDPREVQLSLGSRDTADSARDISPLAVPEDALFIDSTGRSIGDVVSDICREVERRRG